VYDARLLDGRCVVRGDTIAFMMRRVHISDSDLQLAEQALRAFAVRYRADAKRQQKPVVREEFEKVAAECERIAERMKRFREPQR